MFIKVSKVYLVFEFVTVKVDLLAEVLVLGFVVPMKSHLVLIMGLIWVLMVAPFMVQIMVNLWVH